MKKIITLLSFTCLLFTYQTFAKKDIYPGQIINWNNPITLRQAVPAPPINSFGGSNSLFYRTKSLNSYVKFWLNTDNIPAGLGVFTATVNVTIVYYLEDPNSSTTQPPITLANKTLTINYDPASGVKYKNVDVENFPNASKIEVTVNSFLINNMAPTAVQKQFISLQTFIEHERYYNYLNVFGNNIYIPILPVPSVIPDLINNEITISWNAEPFAEGYELEYTFVDDYGDNGPNSYLLPSQVNFSFQHNSTRILLQNTSYTMPLVQEHGYLVFRVRGYGMAGADLDRIFFGIYNANVDGNQTFNVATYPYKFVVDNTLKHTADLLNWQSVTTFAEEGKSKTVVKYMDGTMRTHQTVTSTSTERNAIIAETIYDRQGRPAVNILPAPVDNAAIKFYKKFNLNLQGLPYSQSDFDVLNPNGCGNFTINPLGQNSGAGNYYSAANTNKTEFNAFIPDAKGYPFTRVTYMPDATDRVVRQGNVGEVFQPGITANNTYQKHDTKYFYGKPDQAKLDYLFGNNVGYAEHYQKNMVVDPNGQASVSYVDLDGKTIATALAGQATTSLEPLSSNSSASFIVDLLSGSDIINPQDHSITNSQSFTVSGNGSLYNFKYTLDENTYQALSCRGKTYCLDCIYDLEITLIRDECSKIEYQKKITIGSLTNLNFKCNDASTAASFPFSASLDVGSYTITKKLTVNKQAAEFYAERILNDPNNRCLKTFDSFYKESWSKRDTTRCKVACDACNDEANTGEGFNASNVATAVRACDSLWCNPQLTTACDLAKMGMINDLKPGGQYAIYKDSNGNFSPTFSPISIFGVPSPTVNTLYSASSTILSIPIHLPNNPILPLSNYTANQDSLLKLIRNWPDDLSEKLLPLHPEYCYLKFCDLTFVQQGSDFDTKLMKAATFNDAKTAFGIANVSASGILNFYTQDPFYRNMNVPITNMDIATLRNGLRVKFTNYTGSGNSIVQLALFVTNCPSGNNINNCPGVWGDNINDDEEWQKFKSIYFSIKQEFMQKAREDYVQTSGCCSNGNIGCVAKQNCNLPFVWNHIPHIANNCATNQWINYGNAEKRFITINDIDFPAVANPTTSLYDMKPEEMKAYLQSGSVKSPCPTCPELEAFKMMIWNLQNKKWIYNQSTVYADAVIGLKDTLRQRILRTQNNEQIKITKNNNTFTITSNKCTIKFTADTTINWEKAEILPTCMEIKDYTHAKLNIIVDGAYKTALQITSDCDLFYCDGEAPKPDAPNNVCKCDEKYDPKKLYQLGDIAQFEGFCYIVKKIDSKIGLKIGVSPESKQNWEALCEQTNVCVNPFNLDFESPGGLNILGNDALVIDNNTVIDNMNRGNFVADYYFITNQLSEVSRLPNPSAYPQNLPSKAFIVKLNEPRKFLSKQINVMPNQNYRIAFDYGVWNEIGQGYVTFTIQMNGQILTTITPSNSRLRTIQNIVLVWNSGNSTTANLEFAVNTFVIKTQKYLSLDNIKMECIGNEKTENQKKSIATTTKSRYIPQSSCGCIALCDASIPPPPIVPISCDSLQKNIATIQANEAFATYRDSVFNVLLNGYYAKCMQSIETFSMDYQDAEYHYTLYYYDQSGNLVQTVPPAGVKPLLASQLPNVASARNTNSTTTVLPAHLMKTNYQHNSLNAVVYQKTPDAGESRFYYDKLGRIILSQNAKQAVYVGGIPASNNKGSYSLYDRLGRNIEVGEMHIGSLTNVVIKQLIQINWQNFQLNRAKTEITKTYYDKPVRASINNAFGATGQINLRNRIATVAVFDNNSDMRDFEANTDPLQLYNASATHYNYDIAGNVTELLQDFGKYTPFGFLPNDVKVQSKHIAYQFDLVSGKVNAVNYQAGFEDQFFYKYQYNADNKLTDVFTSSNGIIWENDARYKYYRHGSFARTEYGSDHVQGVDMVYTLQGWLKGANGYGTHSFQDLGRDGNSSNTINVGYQAQNKPFAPDVFSYWLSYHQEDYTPVSKATPYIAGSLQPLITGAYHTDPKELFNGNIRSMYTWLSPFTEAIGMKYTYDQLNRLKTQNAYDVDNGVALGNGLGMALNYDANGNIQELKRYSGVRTAVNMDDLTYHYYNADGTIYTGNPINSAGDPTNKLAYVKDAVPTTIEPSDIESQNANNYAYDAIGNLTKDDKEGILRIEWNLQNKISYIKKNNNTSINYIYNATGNRILKYVNDDLNNVMIKFETYVHDAQGNVMAIYKKESDTSFVKEQSIYGSSRLGVISQPVFLISNYFPINKTPLLTTMGGMRKYKIESYRNTTQYELTNHLGNVLATISDSRTATKSATVLTATDYYAFGMAMPDRKFAINGSEYRFGMNGQEKSNEIFEGAFSAEYWEYDSRIGRRWNIDPIVIMWNSSFACFNGNPIYFKDPTGLTSEREEKPLKKGDSEDLGNGQIFKSSFDEIEVTASKTKFWNKVGDFFSNSWEAFVRFDKKLEEQRNKNDWTPPQKSSLLSGEMPFGNGPNQGNSIQGNAFTKIVDNDGINGYYPGSILGGASQSKLGTIMGTGVKLGTVMGTGVRGVSKFTLASGTGAFEAGKQMFDLGTMVGDVTNTIKEELNIKLSKTNANSISKKNQEVVGRTVKVPPPPVLIYYSLPTTNGCIAGTEQGTQKNYMKIIKQMEAKGYKIDGIDKQIDK